MPQLIQFLAETLGLDYGVVEGSVATLAFLLVAFLLRLLWAASKRDDKQLDLEKMLAGLAVRTLKSYDNNTTAIQQVGEVLGGMKTSFTELVSGLKLVGEGVNTLIKRADTSQPTLDSIKDSIDKIAHTRVIIKDDKDNVLATLHAQPDETGDLVVIYKTHKEKVETTPEVP